MQIDLLVLEMAVEVLVGLAAAADAVVAVPVAAAVAVAVVVEVVVVVDVVDVTVAVVPKVAACLPAQTTTAHQQRVLMIASLAASPLPFHAARALTVRQLGI